MLKELSKMDRFENMYEVQCKNTAIYRGSLDDCYLVRNDFIRKVTMAELVT